MIRLSDDQHTPTKTKMPLVLVGGTTLILGFVLGAFLSFFSKSTLHPILSNANTMNKMTHTNANKRPDNQGSAHLNDTLKKPRILYWAAPMDPNFRRDKPGLSPMGMDLIPVYDNTHQANNMGPGTITISPDVVNNLGVRTVVVEKRTPQNIIHTVGYVKYDEDTLIHIHPRVSGWVEKLYVKATGDPVNKGTPLYSLYSPELVNAQEELILSIQQNNTPLANAAENRLKTLHIPQTFINKIKRDRKTQQTILFYAPHDGIVNNLSIREGFYVQPGTTMFSIATLDQVWVEAHVFERQASLVKIGDPVTMSLDYFPGKTWTSSVDYIYPTLDEKTRTLRLRLRFINDETILQPNMFARIDIHSQRSKPTIMIPREALIRTGRQNRVVLALGEGRFKSIAVIVGKEDKEHIEILEGLNTGEKIVSSAQFLLDSESSKTSDFKRFHHAQTKPSIVNVMGEIKKINPIDRILNISHEAIEPWDMPAMTMDFYVNKDVDVHIFNVGAQVDLKIHKGEHGLEILEGTPFDAHHKRPKEDTSQTFSPSPNSENK